MRKIYVYVNYSHLPQSALLFLFPFIFFFREFFLYLVYLICYIFWKIFILEYLHKSYLSIKYARDIFRIRRISVLVNVYITLSFPKKDSKHYIINLSVKMNLKLCFLNFFSMYHTVCNVFYSIFELSRYRKNLNIMENKAIFETSV